MVFPLNRTKAASLAFKTRHHHASVPVTPYRSTSLLQHDVTHVAGKAYTLPRRQQPHHQSSAGYSPPLTAGGTRLLGDGTGGLTVWLGPDDDVDVDDRLSASAARCTCTLRRAVAAADGRPPTDTSPPPTTTTTTVYRGVLGCTDTPTSFVTFKPAASTTSSADFTRATVPLDCGTFYDLPPLQRDDTGTDYPPSRAPPRDKSAAK